MIINFGENTILIFTFWGYCQIWSLHFSISQFGSCYFHIAVNLVPTINLLMELLMWQTVCTVGILKDDMTNKIIINFFISH